MENLIRFTAFLNHSALLEPAGCRLAEEISQGRRVKRALSYFFSGYNGKRLDEALYLIRP